MADYIYLLQNRLTPAQRRALEAVREAARTRGMPVFLVGGAVRDLSSGAPVRDLDFAVQGDVSGLIQDLKTGGAVIAGENPALSSTFLIFPGGVRAEVGPTLTVTYPKPGHPESQPAAILEDLRRRDFTANAMAISLNEGSFGLLLDPLNGIADMENRELRLVSNYGFIEQPALLLRAARLSTRLGWTLEQRTQNRYETARQENYIESLPAFDRGYELEEIFHEDDPLGTLEHLSGEGWAGALYPAWTSAKADREGLNRVHDLIGQMEQMGIFVDPSPVFFPLLTSKLAGKDLAVLKGMLARQGFVHQIDSLETRSKDLANQLTSKNAAPSETWKLLFASEPEVILWLAFSSRSGAVQTKFKSFLNEWPQARQRLPYALMQEMRITPDLPGYSQLLEDLFFAQIDNKLATPEATRTFLEPYSPPAPVVQASPRRRPAKSAKGRGRKAVEVVVAEPAALEGQSPKVAEVLADSASGGTTQSNGASAPAAKKAGAEPTPAKKAAAKSAPQKAAVAEPVPSPATPSVPGKKSAAPATPKPPVKEAAKAAERRREPAKKVPAKASAKAAPVVKKTANTAPAKKSIPVKRAAAIPAKAHKAKSAPAPVKKAAGKSAPPAKAAKKAPARANVSAKAAPAKKAAGKHAAKKTAAPARKTSAPAKRPVPAKKGKATAAKGRGR